MLLPQILGAQQAEYISSYTFSGSGIGGLSGIDFAENGESFAMISDRGGLYFGNIQREHDQITNIALADRVPLLDADGDELRNLAADSEGIAMSPHGIWISFERDARIVEFNRRGQQIRLFSELAQLPIIQHNSGFEALAISPNGDLFFLPESSARPTQPFPLYRLSAGIITQIGAIPRHSPFLVTGADFGPDGRLYVLERYFSGFQLRNRVRSFLPNGDDERIHLTTAPYTHDNLEGISVWDGGADIRITMISDDNFNFFQRSEIVEYRIPKE